MTDTVETVLWMDTVIKMGDVELNKFLDCLMQLRAYMVDHKTPDGFSYGLVKPVENWWDNKTPRFDAWAKEGCRIFKVPATGGFTQSVAAGVVDRVMAAGKHMDIWEVWRPGGWPPDWMVVYKTATYWLVCLASETTEKAPG